MAFEQRMSGVAPQKRLSGRRVNLRRLLLIDGPSLAALAYIVAFADADRALAAVSAKFGQPEDEVQ